MNLRRRAAWTKLLTLASIVLVMVITAALPARAADGNGAGALFLPVIGRNWDGPRPLPSVTPIPSPTAMPTPNPSDLRSTVVYLTNQERVKAGCSPLSINPLLTQAAQAHSEDMAARNYFSHYSPEGETPWDRIHKTGYVYVRAAENIAMGYSSPQAVMTGWMNSPGHRANILDCALREIGVGYATNQNANLYWTQVFGTAPTTTTGTISPTPTHTPPPTGGNDPHPRRDVPDGLRQQP